MKKKFKLKKSVVKKLKIVGVVFGIVLAIFLFYRSQINSLKELGYTTITEDNAKEVLDKIAEIQSRKIA